MAYGKVRLKIVHEKGVSVVDVHSNENASGVLDAVQVLRNRTLGGFGTISRAICTLEVNGEEKEQWVFIVR